MKQAPDGQMRGAASRTPGHRTGRTPGHRTDRTPERLVGCLALLAVLCAFSVRAARADSVLALRTGADPVLALRAAWADSVLAPRGTGADSVLALRAAGADPVFALRAAGANPMLARRAAGTGKTSGGAEGGTVTSRQALVPALMSAVVPGSGQLRNGSVFKGLAFAAVELTGWMAWFSFRHQASEKYDDIESFGDRYWEYNRYRRVAQNPDSCAANECPYGLYSALADSLIRLAQDQGGNRFYDYLTRDAYACGWDTHLSRNLYMDLHADREDLLDAKRITGRLIFLNHAVAAVDAFLQARRVRVAGFADVGLRMTGLPGHPLAQLTFTKRWD
jgi:hypothetical protein